MILLSTYAAAHYTPLVQRWDKKAKEMVEVVRLNIVSIYNLGILDSLIALYRTEVRLKKWYHRLFVHMMDVTMVQAWLLYRRDCNDCGVPNKEQIHLLNFTTEVDASAIKTNFAARGEGHL